MKESYEDIANRIAEPPKWYDTNGTPRYDDFHPKYCPNIYADVVVLLWIECQSCRQKFDVEVHGDVFHPIPLEKEPIQTLHYGDPPFHGCVGDTMNCDDLCVLQVWSRHNAPPLLWDWARHPELEGPIPQTPEPDTFSIIVHKESPE
jgi:hypothetical protein